MREKAIHMQATEVYILPILRTLVCEAELTLSLDSQSVASLFFLLCYILLTHTL